MAAAERMLAERMLEERAKTGRTVAAAVEEGNIPELVAAAYHCELNESWQSTQSALAFVLPFRVSFLCFQGALAFVLPCELSILTRKLSALTSCFLS